MDTAAQPLPTGPIARPVDLAGTATLGSAERALSLENGVGGEATLGTGFHRPAEHAAGRALPRTGGIGLLTLLGLSFVLIGVGGAPRLL